MRDVDDICRRLDSVIRMAARIRLHAPDLYRYGWEPSTTGGEEKVNGGGADRTPRAGHPRARQLFERIAVEVAQIEAELVGLDRAMHALFFAGSANPEPSRGSTIRCEEFDRLVVNQWGRDDTPARLVDQPDHPGRQS